MPCRLRHEWLDDGEFYYNECLRCTIQKLIYHDEESDLMKLRLKLLAKVMTEFAGFCL